MSVATAKKKTTVAERAAAEQLFDGVASENRAEFLQTECLAVTLRISWYPQARVVRDASAARMTQAIEGDSKAFSIVKRLFSVDHPKIKRLKDIRRDIASLFHSRTVPLAKIGEQLEGDEQLQLFIKEAGKRVILASQVEAFHAKVDELRQELYEAAQAADTVLDELIEKDRAKHGDAFKESDYPESIAKSVYIEGPFYDSLATPVALERLAPQAAEAIKAELRRKTEATVTLAADDLANQLHEITGTLVRQLACKVFIDPPAGSDYEAYRKCEVVDLVTPEIDPTLPAGHVRFGLYRDDKIDPKIDETVTMRREAYEELRPRATEKRGKLYESSCSQLEQLLGTFEQVRLILGPQGGALGDAVSKLKATIPGISSAQTVLSTAKESTSFRDSAAQALEAFRRGLTTYQVDLRTESRKRNIVFRNRKPDAEE